jgi:hypothetical protein
MLLQCLAMLPHDLCCAMLYAAACFMLLDALCCSMCYAVAGFMLLHA